MISIFPIYRFQYIVPIYEKELISLYNSASGQNENSEFPKTKKGFTPLFEELENIIDPKEIVNVVKERYLYIPKLRTEDYPLKWCKRNQGYFYPNILKFGQQYFADQGLSVLCEGVFKYTRRYN